MNFFNMIRRVCRDTIRFVFVGSVASELAVCVTGCKANDPANMSNNRSYLAVRQPEAASSLPPTFSRLKPKLAKLSSYGKNNVFTAYDCAMVLAVEKHWYEMLDAVKKWPSKGRVILDFELDPDGGISNMVVRKSTVDKKYARICERSVLDLAPFGPSPSDARKVMTDDTRAVHFEFNYD